MVKQVSNSETKPNADGPFSVEPGEAGFLCLKQDAQDCAKRSFKELERTNQAQISDEARELLSCHLRNVTEARTYRDLVLALRCVPSLYWPDPRTETCTGPDELTDRLRDAVLASACADHTQLAAMGSDEIGSGTRAAKLSALELFMRLVRAAPDRATIAYLSDNAAPICRPIWEAAEGQPIYPPKAGRYNRMVA